MISIAIRNPQKKIPVNLRKIKQVVSKIIADSGLSPNGEVNISFITDALIKRLNSRFHQRNCPTDVLAFDLSRNNKELIADIYVSVDTAIKNSKVFLTSPKYELFLYVIHGMLHIAGYDDHKPRDIKAMRERESFYLKIIRAQEHRVHV